MRSDGKDVDQLGPHMAGGNRNWYKFGKLVISTQVNRVLVP